ncbi:MAG: phosphoribosylformylglycinamidine synthase subunit PurL [Spirochaetaceae bacterium]|nr:MAG: phosphoribosylformylglycinamidine synthase subunit PurL [Spirochaetaceae bacterium]
MGFTTDTFDLTDRPDEEILAFLGRHSVGLTLEEARQLQFSILNRPPSLAEYILFGIEGSEHCSYKSSRVHLKQFITEGENVVLGAKEDAGVIRVARDGAGRGYCVVISHESHNHPSQIVPYEGAATGVGGNVRDICCMGAEVVALADDLRFGDIRTARSKWIYHGAVSGIAGYGNPIGVPSVAGGLQFDRGYQDNCLVTVVSLGILREDRIFHSHAPTGAAGYNLILVGKPTDGSGFGGASFASFELLEEEREQNKGAVQEPNAFLGRHLLQASTALFEIISGMGMSDRVGCKDLGAGGIACAGVEIAESGGYGAEIDLDLVHTDEATSGGGDPPASALPPYVVLCSETQERYLWAVPPDLTKLVLDHFNVRYALPEVSRGAQARVIGRITESPRFIVAARGEVIVDAPAAEVTRGFLYNRSWTEPPADPGDQVDRIESARAAARVAAEVGAPADASGAASGVAGVLLSLLEHENVASREALYECYDKQVQGRVSVEAGEGDSGVLAPFNDHRWPEEIRETGITLTTDQNPRINRRDPYRGAVQAVVETWTNTIASGAEPIAISDCLCYGNPEKPDQMGQFVAGCRGVAEAARELTLPVVAGNVSFYNESSSASIPPSPMIACVGRLENYRSALPARFTAPGSTVYLVGDRTGRWGGSIFEEILREAASQDLPPGPLPEVDFDTLRKGGAAIRAAASRGLIRACHDISEGGLAVTLCEMSFPRGPGCGISPPGPDDIPPVVQLFEETPGFVLEVAADAEEGFLECCREHDTLPRRLGETREEQVCSVEGMMTLPIPDARERWERGLREKLQ